MKIDGLAFEPHFVDHVASVMNALPRENRGRVVVPERLIARARANGLAPADDFTREQRPVIVSSYGDLKKARTRDRSRLILIEHGIGQSFSSDHPSYPGGRDRHDVGLYLAPNAHAAGRMQSAYPDLAVAIVGSPRTERLPQREPHPSDDGRPVIAISFHWNSTVSFESRPAWRHYRRELRFLARRYRLLGHGHPRMMSRLVPVYEQWGIEVEHDFDEVCRRADLYICDGVSTLYEFASTGRPVVVLNAPWYRRRVNHGLRFWEAADVGIQVNMPRELYRAIDTALRDPAPVRRRREAALDIVYAHRHGAAARAAQAILSWVAQPRRVAA